MRWRSPTEIADTLSPFRKSEVPSFGSTTQHLSFLVSTCPVSSPHQSQRNSKELIAQEDLNFGIDLGLIATAPWAEHISAPKAHQLVRPT
ncbi:hypothetical protein PSPTOT1_5424 [Pseudomonas syringae pv. tomato T1]|nr:hypothetical protein PSPTOT1_5424 [Pseudomonas syringae pv. tomato T1]